MSSVLSGSPEMCAITDLPAIAKGLLRAYNAAMKIYDISIPISTTMPTYPGDPAVTIEPMWQIAQGDAANVSRLAFGNHTGTHVDPPVHFIPGGKTVDQLDLNILIGAARVIDLTRVAHEISANDLARARIPRGTQRILLKTRNSMLWEQTGFQKNFVGLGWDAAQWLVERKIKLIGIDYLSVETFGASEPRTHRTLLGANIIVVEGLNLMNIKPGKYTLICLPLNIEHGDGAPARAVLIQQTSEYRRVADSSLSPKSKGRERLRQQWFEPSVKGLDPVVYSP